MAIFNSYVKLPEGIWKSCLLRSFRHSSQRCAVLKLTKSDKASPSILFLVCSLGFLDLKSYGKARLARKCVTCRLSPDARHSQCDISPLGKKPGPQIKRPKNCKGKVRERDGEREDRIKDRSSGFRQPLI